MKKIILLLVIIVYFVNCKNKEKQTLKGTLIAGKASQNLFNKPIYLKYIKNDSVFTKIDTVSSSGKFEFTVVENEYPLKAFLTDNVSNHATKVKEVNQLSSLIYFQFGSPNTPKQFGKKKDMKMFLLEKGKMKIEITDSIYKSKIFESKLNKELNKLSNLLNPIMFRSNKFSKIKLSEIKDKEILDSLLSEYTQINLKKTSILNNFIETHKNSFSSAYAFNLKPYTQKEDIEIFKKINPEIRNSKIAEIGRIKIKRFVNNTTISTKIENFNLLDRNNKKVSLHDIKSKYILLDLWASWCAPCRKENKGIMKYYSKFNKEDFQVVGISVDKNKNQWLNALNKDNIEWISLIDDKFRINDKLGVTSYPTNFLMNSNYKVIEKNLSSEKLKETLNKLLE